MQPRGLLAAFDFQNLGPTGRKKFLGWLDAGDPMRLLCLIFFHSHLSVCYNVRVSFSTITYKRAAGLGLMWQIQHWVLVEEVDRPNPCGGRLETRAPLCQASALLKRVVNRPIFGRTECIQRVLGRPGFRAGWSEGKCEETKRQDLPGHRKIPLPFQIAVRSFVGLNILRNDYLVSSSVDRKQQLR